jgi:hypothetical protein
MKRDLITAEAELNAKKQAEETKAEASQPEPQAEQSETQK